MSKPALTLKAKKSSQTRLPKSKVAEKLVVRVGKSKSTRAYEAEPEVTWEEALEFARSRAKYSLKDLKPAKK